MDIAVRSSYPDKAGSHRASLNGFLGILEHSHSASDRHADLGFRETLGKLGRAVGAAAFDGMAKKLERIVYITLSACPVPSFALVRG